MMSSRLCISLVVMFLATRKKWWEKKLEEWSVRRGCEAREQAAFDAHAEDDGDDYEGEGEAEQRAVVERGVLEHPRR